MELYARSADLGFSKAHSHLDKTLLFRGRFDEKEVPLQGRGYDMSASAGCYSAMHTLRILFEEGSVSR